MRNEIRGLLAAASLLVLATGAPASAQPLDLRGTWDSSIGLVYEFQQTGSSFTWQVQGRKQVGQGTVNGLAVQASWQGARGSGSAKGTLITDPVGRATEIKWSNGVTFVRRKLPPVEQVKPQDKGGAYDVAPVPVQPIQPPKLERPEAMPPSAAGRPFVYDVRVVQRSSLSALLEVSYSYNPPKGSGAMLSAEVFADGDKVGSHGTWTPIPFAAQGKVLMPISIGWLDVRFGLMRPPGNRSDEIQFLLREPGQPGELKRTLPFDLAWGDDHVELLRARSKPVPGPKKLQDVELDFYTSVDHRHFGASNGGVEVDMWVKAYWKGKEAPGGSGGATLVKQPPTGGTPPFGDTHVWWPKTIKIRRVSDIDEIRIGVTEFHAGVTRQIYRRSFPVKLSIGP